jgi:hypothetical protein
MAFTAANVLESARRILQDTGVNGRWTDANLLLWYNEGQIKIVTLVPTSLAVYAAHTLVAGAEQDIGSTYYTLIDVTHNAIGGVRGTLVTRADEATIDIEDPTWRAGAGAATVYHWMQREGEDKTFRVYPPRSVAASTAQVMIRACLYPTVAVAATTSQFPDEYRQILVDYVVYRAFLEDQPNETNHAAAARHFQIFADQLGMYK